MNVAVITLIVIGIIAIIVSFVLTPKEEEKVNPNIPTELSDADKKHLEGLADKHMKEYSKKKITRIVIRQLVKNSLRILER